MLREHGPVRQREINRAAHGAFGQMPAAALHAGERTVDAFQDHAAFGGSSGLTLLRSTLALAQLLFDAVEMLDLQQHLACVLRGALDGLMKLAPGVRPARGQGDAPLAAFGKGWIGQVAVALQRAGEVSGGRCAPGRVRHGW